MPVDVVKCTNADVVKPALEKILSSEFSQAQ